VWIARVAVALAVSVAVAGAIAPAAAEPTALLIFQDASPGEIRAIVSAAGGRVVALFPGESTALVAGPEAALAALAADPRVAAGSQGPLTGEEIPGLPEPQRLAAAAWNRLKAPPLGPLAAAPDGDPLIHDAIEPPPAVATRFREPADESGLDGRPYGARWDNTSEFMAGTISLTVFLLESDGSVDPNVYNWTLDQESQVLSNVMQAATNAAALYPGAPLSFVVHMVYGRTGTVARTGTEPINRPAATGGTNGEDVWVREVMGKLGYADPYAHRTVLTRRHADATRIADGSDWAVAVFVAHTGGNAGAAGADADGKFTDGRFGYAYLGGPHIVLTYSNDGWGISRLHMVLLHELHHSFFVLDEYYGSNCTCTAHAGYLDGLNDNCQVCASGQTGCTPCPTDTACVMRNNVAIACAATKRQAGTYDTDADGTPDVSDLPPEVALAVDTASPAPPGRARLAGAARIVRLASRNPGYSTTHADFSVVRLAAVETSIDDGPWSAGAAVPDDGAFDGFLENFTLDLALPAGPHWIAARAVDERGQRSTPQLVPVTVAPVTESVGTPSITATRQGGAVRLAWSAVAGATRYAVRRTTSPTPAAFLAATPANAGTATSWTDAAPPPLAFYRVFAVDAGGAEVPAPGGPSP
jgi:hypothetical protein